MTDEPSQYAKAENESARFTMILNDAIRDDRISWRAKGILAGCMSHANSFQFSKSWIIEHGTEGRDAVNNALNELRKYGYLEDRISKCSKTGKILGWGLIFKDRPSEPKEDRLPENPSDGETVSLKTRQTGKPSDGKPVTIRRPINPEDQSQENQVAQRPATPETAARGSARFTAETKHIPFDLQNVAAMICEFFNEHKAGAKTKRAFDGLIKELLQIKLDKSGGIKAVQNQLSTAIKRSAMGEKKWASITYENWQRFGQGNQSNAKLQTPQLPMISVAFAEDMV
jgi:hypothetical protein